MKLRITDVCQWGGEISRGPFIVWALLLFAIKYNLDRVILLLAFGRHWSALSYFGQPSPAIEDLLTAQSPREYATLLEGTTWYRHNLWPAGYWQLWSDHIIHTIHRRVLDHVKGLAEEDLARGQAP